MAQIKHLFLFIPCLVLMQFSGLGQVDKSKDPIQVFKDTRILNAHSTETNIKGQLTFIIQHRFGRVNGGGYELFGLDQATMRMGLDYGLFNSLTIGLGRSTFEKTIDAYAKYQIKPATKSSPLAINAMSSIAMNGLKWADETRKNYFTSRLYYTHQLLFAYKVSPELSIQTMPSLVHRNLIPDNSSKHDVMALGLAGKYQISKQIGVQLECYLVDRGTLGTSASGEGFYAPISVGFDIDTKGHVFQFHFSNSRGIIEKSNITETTGNWLDGDIHFGFNITRDFRVRGRK